MTKPTAPSAEDYKKEIGKAIKRRRKACGISQAILARSIGKHSPAYIAFIESANRNISISDFVQLCFSLKIVPSDFLKSINL